MKYRYMTLWDGDPGAASGTKILDITAKDIITQLVIRFYATAGSTTISEHPASNITKLELVDGSDVLYSLTGQCAEAMDFYQVKDPRVNRIYYRNGEPWVTVMKINFGRFFGDRKLALDPKKFQNLQLKITYNEDVANTSSSARSLFVKAVLFDESPPMPQGFLMTKEQKTYTPTANAYEYTDLPTDHPYRSLAIQCRKTGTRFGSTVADLKLSEDADKRVPFDDKASILAQYASQIFGTYQEFIIAYVAASLTAVYITPGLDVGVGAGVQGDIKASEVELGVGCKMNVARETAAGYVQLILNGWLPHHVLCLPMGRRNEIDDWYDVKKLGSLQLSLKGGGSLGTTDTFRIITEQMRRY